MATTAELQVVIRAQDQASKVLQGIAGALGGLQKPITAATGVVKGFTSALGQIGLAAAGVQAVAAAASGLGGAFGTGLANQMEQVTARFNAFTKDSAVTERVLAQVREEANKTPFAFAEMANAAAMLLPASKSAQGGLMGLIREAEILAALNPSEGLEGAAFALREALSGDFVSVMERFNIPRELINRLKAEGVPNAQIVGRALKEMGADVSLVGNLAATTEGRLSTFRDAIDGIRLVVGQPILAALGEQLDAMSGWLSENEEAVKAFAQNLGDFLAQAVQVGGEASGRLFEFLRPLGPAIADLGRAALAMVHGDWANAMNGLRSAAATAIEFLDTRFGPLGRVVASVATAALAAVNGDWRGAMTQMGAAAERAGAIGPVLGAAVDRVREGMSAFAPTGERLGALFATIGEKVGEVVPHVLGFVEGVRDAAQEAGGAQGLLDGLAGAVNAVSGAAETAVGWLTQTEDGMVVLGAATGALSAALAIQATRWAATQAAMVAARVAAVAMAASQAALNLIMNANPISVLVVALAALVGALITAYNTNEDFRNIVNAVWETVKTAVGTAIAFVLERVNAFQAWFQGAGGTFQTAAAAIGQGIVNGIAGAISAGMAWVTQKATELANAALAAAKRVLGIESPSREFEEVGENVVEGFVLGIEGGTGEVAGAVEETMGEAVVAAETTFADLATVLGAQFEKTFGIIERAEVQIENARDQITRQSHRDQEVAERQHHRRLTDLEEQLGGARGDARKKVLERIRQEHENHARKIEDIEFRLADRLDEIEVDRADILRDAREKQALERGKALQEFSRDTDRLASETGRRAEEIGRKASEALREAADSAAAATEEANERALVSVQELLARRTLDRGIRGRRDALDERQDEAEREFKERRDTAEREHKLAQDLAEAKLKFERDYRKADTDEERTRIRDQYDEERDNIRRRFELARADAERRKRLDAEERVFRQQQEQERQRFTDTLEDEAIVRQIERINTERDERVRGITQALEEKVRKTLETEARERDELRRSAEQKMSDLRERFLDKIGPATEEAGKTIQDFIAGILVKVLELTGAATTAATAIGNIKAPAAGAAAAGGGGGGGGGAALRPGGKPGETQAEVDAFNANAAKAHNDNIIKAGGTPTTQQFQAAGTLKPGETLKRLASGGWITEPVLGTGLTSGDQYLIGEAGDELVTPRSRLAALAAAYGRGGAVTGGAPPPAGGAQGGSSEHTHAIYLDGRLVGEALEPHVSGAQTRAVRLNLGNGAMARTLPVYSIEVAWSRTTTGAFIIGTSTIGGSDEIGGLFSHYTFDSIKTDVKDITIRRGRTGQDGAMAAGTCSIVLADTDGTYNPENTGSSLSPNVVPLRPIRVQATHASTTYGLFFGFITRIEHDPHPSVQETRIEAVDFFHWLDVSRPVMNLPTTTVGAAITAILRAAGLTDPDYLDIDTGARVLPPVVTDGSTSALQLLQNILDVDMGVLFVDGDGKVTYQDTSTRYGGAAAVDTFSGSVLSGARPSTDIALVRNGWTVTRDAENAVPQTYQDLTTRTFGYYGARDGTPITSKYLVDDAQALALATFKVLLHKDPTNPVRGIRISNRDDTNITKQLARDVGDKVAVTESLGGTSTTGFIEGVEHHIWEAGAHHEATFTVSKQRIGSVTY